MSYYMCVGVCRSGTASEQRDHTSIMRAGFESSWHRTPRGNNEGFHFQVTPQNPERERWSYIGVKHTKKKTLNLELFRLKLRHICVRVWQRLEIIKTHKTLQRNS